MFIIDTNKNIIWHGATEFYNPINNTWIQRSKYRASIVLRSQLEELIWKE